MSIFAINAHLRHFRYLLIEPRLICFGIHVIRIRTISHRFIVSHCILSLLIVVQTIRIIDTESRHTMEANYREKCPYLKLNL